MRGKTIGAVAGVAALLAAAACGAPSSGGGAAEDGKNLGTGAKNSGKAVETMDANAKAPAAEIKGATKGGTIKIASSSTPPSTLDPATSYYTDSGSIQKLITRSLTQYQYRDGNMVLVPDLATDLGRPNKDFTRWEFTLRDGIKFEDGTPVTSKDLAYGVKRMFATDELPGGPTYGQDFFLDGDKYEGPYKDKGEFKAIETPNDKTIVFKMRKTFADMPFFASMSGFAPVPQAKDTRADYQTHPIATGPYKFDKFEVGKKLTLVANDQWEPKTDNTRHQYADKFVFTWGAEPLKLQKEVIASNNEDAKITVVPDSLDATLVADLKKNNANDRLIRGATRCSYYTYLDDRVIPADVRKAIGIATPIEDMNKAGGSVPGLNWAPGTSIMPLGTPGAKKFDVFGTGGKGNGDPVAAKAILKKAGKLGFELKYYVRSDFDQAQKISLVKKQAYEKAGFKVTIIPRATAQYRAELQLDKGTVNMRPGGWCPDWASGSSVFPAQWDPRKNKVAGVPNPAFPQDQAIATKIDELLKLPSAEALSKWGDLDEYIMKKYAVVPLGEDIPNAVVGTSIGNPTIDFSKSMPDYVTLYVKK